MATHTEMTDSPQSVHVEGGLSLGRHGEIVGPQPWEVQRGAHAPGEDLREAGKA